MLPAKAWKLVVVSAFVVGGVAGGAVLTHASEPPAQTVAVSATPGTQTYSWTGTIPAGSNATSDCTTEDGTPLVDDHGFTIVVPDSGYSGFKTTFTFQIAWQPVSGNESTNDEILTVTHQADADAGDTEAQEVGSSDGSDTKETVVATNLASGSYDATACG